MKWILIAFLYISFLPLNVVAQSEPCKGLNCDLAGKDGWCLVTDSACLAREEQKRIDARIMKIRKKYPQFEESFLQAEKSFKNRDCKEALKIFLKLGKKDVPHAQLRLGAIYATGACAVLDLARGYMWLSLSASNGSDDARKSLVQLRTVLS